jgi:predicted DNA-binding transcriptional regulator AlpA
MVDILSVTDLMRRYGKSRGTILRLMRADALPAPINPEAKRAFKWFAPVLEEFERTGQVRKAS